MFIKYEHGHFRRLLLACQQDKYTLVPKTSCGKIKNATNGGIPIDVSQIALNGAARRPRLVNKSS